MPHGHIQFRGGENLERSTHPDLRDDDAAGASLPSGPMTSQQRRDREYDRRYAEDESFRVAEAERLRPSQERLPWDIQRELNGRILPGTPSEGRRNYDVAKRTLARLSSTVLESDIASMSIGEYDRYFDAAGLIRPGYRLVYDVAQTVAEPDPLRGAERYVVDRRGDVPTRPYEEQV